MAVYSGGGWWPPDSDEDRARYEEMVEEVGKQVLKNLQGVIIEMIRARDSDSLTSLQACCGELFMRAKECMTANMDMGVNDEG